jgi:magnesium-transporting ATPase (P-type)
MGQRGTEGARAVAIPVLFDDNVAMFVNAVRGRRSFENLRRAFTYLIVFHLAILLAAWQFRWLGALATVAGPLRLAGMDHAKASLGFGNDPPTDLMQRPPRNPCNRTADEANAIVPGQG